MKTLFQFTAIVLLTGTFAYLSCKKEYSCEDCRTANEPPVANAGPDQVIALPVDNVLLDGSSSSDADGNINSFKWVKISGPASFSIGNISADITAVNDLLAGVYQFELTVTDKEGLSASDTVQITVNGPVNLNQPPIADAGADQTIISPADNIFLNANGSSDPDGTIIAYQWRKISGPASFVIDNALAEQTGVSGLTEGVYLFELMVTDNNGLVSKDIVTVNVIFSSCSGANLSWTLGDNGMMVLINPVTGPYKSTLSCGYGGENFIPIFYDVWVQFEGSSDWLQLEYVFRNDISSAGQNIFLSSTYYFDPNDGGVSLPLVCANPNSGIDFTKKVTVINHK